ncbi:serine hydrolase domain-containing protein [Nonomuraea africana]|uniref:CubicO group peptidase (Beta-lactamase class C family) n=1 Tax=Nonomuraea africana TaxID=46171 RepID=A0ABR9KBX8_9ACTN|nr:serine hydrolase domain-containing protein [Nonomuraea africana]MBE1559523.1 CubicO group peptidase (beta-lactamase class C family) [Nonomuraea africana]
MDLQKRLDEAARRHDVPGAAVAVWTGTELVEAATGVLNRNTGVETTVDSLFQVGSTTKIWTATLVMRLVEEGLVDLDTPVREYLPEFGVADPETSKAVTVRHLLTHTGGFDGDLFEDTGRGDDCVERYLEFLHGAGQAHPLGALFSYCNSGYVVLGALAARFGGGTWEQTMRERLLEPLGVTHAALLPEEAILFRASAGHVGPDNAVHPGWQMPRSNAPAGSTMCLAPRELVRFGRMFLDGGEGVLKAETIAAMTTPQVDVPGVPGLMADRWGLGFELFDWGAPVFGHDGGTIGQSTFWRIIPGSGVTIAMSGNGGGFLGLIDEVALPVIRELTGLPVPALPTPPERPERVDAAPYTGTYATPAAVLEVTGADGGLDVTTVPGEYMARAGAERVTERYVHMSGQTFIKVKADGGGHLPITFVIEDGRAAYLHNGRAVPRA